MTVATAVYLARRRLGKWYSDSAHSLYTLERKSMEQFETLNHLVCRAKYADQSALAANNTRDAKRYDNVANSLMTQAQQLANKWGWVLE